MRFAVFLTALLLLPAHVVADTPPLAEARVDSGRSHLWRNLVWGSASLAGGGALALLSDRQQHPTRWGFGVQFAAWGAIDVGIAVTGLLILRGPAAGRTRAELIEKERLYHDALLVNIGLDVAYMATGAAVLVAGYRGVDNAAEWRGHGSAIMIQGAALLTFELIAWRGSRQRLTTLLAGGDGITDLAPTPLTIAGPFGDAHGLALTGRF